MNEERFTEEGREETAAASETPPPDYKERAGEARSTEGKSARELEEDLARIREEMDHTIRSLEQRFSPGELLDRLLHSFSGGPGEYAGNLGRSLKENPLPATLVGIGLSWLIASSQSSRSYSSPGTSSSGAWKEKAGGMKEKMHETASSMRGKASEWSHAYDEKKSRAEGKWQGAREDARQRGSEWADSAREAGSRTRGGLEYLLHDQPLILGALGIAVGSAIGAALPPTRKEDRVMGEKRDQALDQSREFGKEQMEKGKAVAEKSLESAREETESQIH